MDLMFFAEKNANLCVFLIAFLVGSLIWYS